MADRSDSGPHPESCSESEKVLLKSTPSVNVEEIPTKFLHLLSDVDHTSVTFALVRNPDGDRRRYPEYLTHFLDWHSGVVINRIHLRGQLEAGSFLSYENVYDTIFEDDGINWDTIVDALQNHGCRIYKLKSSRRRGFHLLRMEWGTRGLIIPCCETLRCCKECSERSSMVCCVWLSCQVCYVERECCVKVGRSPTCLITCV